MRPQFRFGLAPIAMTIGVCLARPAHRTLAADVPPALADAQARFYSFLVDIANGQGVTSAQRLVINSTIIPFDIVSDTPFYNEELFRQDADRTSSGAVGSIEGSTVVSQAPRFRSQYRAVLTIAAAQIDQNHPEIRHSINELHNQLSAAITRLVNKNNEIENAWVQVAAARHLTDPTTPLGDSRP